MDGKALAKRKSQNSFGDMRPIFVSILLALIVTGCASLLGAQIMVSQNFRYIQQFRWAAFVQHWAFLRGRYFKGSP